MIQAKRSPTSPACSIASSPVKAASAPELYSSLNCGYGSGDSPDNVRENRRRVADAFGLGEPDLLTLHQIHSTEVLTVATERWTSPGAPKADGLVTDRPGVVLGVMAADCAPVLFADARRRA